MNEVKRIKICHVVTRLDVGGMENGIINICNKLDRSRFVPTVCCLNATGKMAHRLNPDVLLFDMKFKEGKSILSILKLAWFLKNKIKPDIIHTHAWGGGALYGILGARLAGVPIIINGEHGSFFLKRHQILFQRILAALCDVTLSVSESLKQRVVQNLGIDADRIVVIPNGVDTDKFTGDYDCSILREALKKEYGFIIDSDDMVIGCIGSLKPEKNQIMLLRSLKKIQEKFNNNLKTIFVGDGIDRSILTEFVEKNNLSDNVLFLGIREDIYKILSLADILISTSISKHEGMSNIILEAMSSKLPVIATQSIGMSEIIKDGLTGFIINTDDINGLTEKILLLTHNIDLRNRMGMAAFDLIRQKYSIEAMVMAYEKMYTSLFTQKREWFFLHN